MLGITGLSMASSSIIDTAYDVLGLEAVFLVPRIFSLLSLNPYFGTLVSVVECGQTVPQGASRLPVHHRKCYAMRIACSTELALSPQSLP